MSFPKRGEAWKIKKLGWWIVVDDRRPTSKLSYQYILIALGPVFESRQKQIIGAATHLNAFELAKFSRSEQWTREQDVTFGRTTSASSFALPQDVCKLPCHVLLGPQSLRVAWSLVSAGAETKWNGFHWFLFLFSASLTQRPCRFSFCLEATPSFKASEVPLSLDSAKGLSSGHIDLAAAARAGGMFLFSGGVGVARNSVHHPGRGSCNFKFH